jgi:hypothetical protein
VTPPVTPTATKPATPVTKPVLRPAILPKPNPLKKTVARNRKNTMNHTQKIDRQKRRVRAAYEYVLDEIQRMQDFLNSSVPDNNT